MGPTCEADQETNQEPNLTLSLYVLLQKLLRVNLNDYSLAEIMVSQAIIIKDRSKV